MGINIPFISLIMPVYNSQKHVNKSIMSVVNQTYMDWELILIDDCSSDGSMEILKQWSENDDRIHVIPLESNGGAGRARNTGIRTAKGIYLGFIDSDDSIEKVLLETVTERVKIECPDVAVWGLTEVYFGKNNNEKHKNIILPDKDEFLTDKDIFLNTIALEHKTLFGYQWNHLYRRELILKCKAYFPETPLYEDYFFNLSVIKHAQSISVIRCGGYYYNKRLEESLTGRFVKEYFNLSRIRIKSMMDLLEEHECLTDWNKNILGERYLRYILSALMRDSDKQSGLTVKQRLSWVEGLSKDDVFLILLSHTKVHSKWLRLLKNLIDRKHSYLCLGYGDLVYFFRKRLPYIFYKLKKCK